MEKFFKLKEHGTNISTELLAGMTTFMTMAYILVVNPNILEVAGMDKGAVFTATAIAAIIGTVCMALFANYPFALAPGMGLNAYFAYTVVLTMGYTWQMALMAVFVEGLIFILLTAVNIREAIFNAIPTNLKFAVSAGIGLFIAFIGFQNSGIIIDSQATLVELGDVTQPSVIIALVGVLITAILVAKRVKGSILLGILITWGLAILSELVGFYVPAPEAGLYSVIPTGIVSTPPSIVPIVGKAFEIDIAQIFSFEFLFVVFAFLFVDLFDTLGTLIGVSSKAGLLDKEGKLPRAKQALFADAVATTAGALLGTSTTTTYVESAAGVSDGGRTGLTALSTAAFFLVALIFSPIFLAIPGFATAPALIIVGFYMMESVTKITFSDYTEGIPAFLTLLVMPISYSISEGIVFGFVSYTLINLFTGNGKKLNVLMYIISILMVLKYFI